MNFFKQRETPAQNIAFMAIMCALAALFSLFGALFPLAAVFIMIFMPLVSIMVAIYCRPIYYPIYLASACLVCFIVSCWDFQTTLFYAYPAIIVGFIYGFLLRNKVPSSINVFATSILQFFLFLVSLLLIKAIYAIDMQELLFTLIGKRNDVYVSMIFPCFAFAYSLGQIGLSHLFISTQLKRLGIDSPSEEKAHVIYPSCGMLFSLVAITISFTSATAGYLLMAFAFYWGILCCFTLAKGTHWGTWTCLAVLIGVSILLIAAFYNQMDEGKGLILICLLPLSIAISSFFNLLILRKNPSGNKIQP